MKALLRDLVMYIKLTITALFVIFGVPLFILIMPILTLFANKDEDWGRFNEYDREVV